MCSRRLLRYLAMAFTLSAAAVLSDSAMAFEKCSKSDGPAAYKRCLAYARMAGTPSQRDYAGKQMAAERKERKNRCWYSKSARETVCRTTSY